MSDSLIEQFETEFRNRGYDLRRSHSEGVYADSMTEGAWRGYESGRNYPTPDRSLLGGILKELETRIHGEYGEHEPYGRGLDQGFQVAINIIRNHFAESKAE